MAMPVEDGPTPKRIADSAVRPEPTVVQLSTQEVPMMLQQLKGNYTLDRAEVTGMGEVVNDHATHIVNIMATMRAKQTEMQQYVQAAVEKAPIAEVHLKN